MSASDSADPFDPLGPELSAWLDAADPYEVVRTLKQTPDETTQVVYRKGAHGQRGVGPFVRKTFVADAGRGAAYQRILQAQVDGRRLAHQPVVYECTPAGDRLEVVMEYVHGVTLRELAAREGAGVPLARRVMPALCDAATELHEGLDQPVIHRDIKPSNVMVATVSPDDSSRRETGDRLVLIDLGIARMYREGAPRDTVRYGTPGYAPPEQFGYGQTSVRSDVYALGMTLAFCLLGTDPGDELREGGFVDPRIPAPARAVLVRATHFDPAQRYGSAAEMREAVVQALDQALVGPVAPHARRGRGSARAGAGPGEARRDDAVPVSGVRRRLGIVWDVLLVCTWVVLILACVFATVAPADNVAPYYWPLWFRLIGYTGMVAVPATALGYLLLYKPPVRRFLPFEQREPREERRQCLRMAALSFGVTLLVCILLGWNFVG